MKSLKNILIGVIIVVIILLITSFFYTKRIITKSFPKDEGEIFIDGLKEQVRIYRDEFGIPYIEANNEDDLFFALGFVHAQDRLFQMDITRRAGMGKLSEILGSKALEFDLMFRVAGFSELAKKLYNNSSNESKRICDSYTRGINSFLEYSKDNYPLEFDLLAYEPEKWEPYHIYLISRLVAWELNLGWWTDVVFGQLKMKLPPEKFNQIVPDYPEEGAVIIKSKSSMSKISQNLSSNYNSFNLNEHITTELHNFFNSNLRLRTFLGLNYTYSGSNSWVISPKLSETGKPILANDPHLMYSMPSKWYIVSLNSPTIKASGVSIPGSPAIIIGKNDRLAWGLTNLMLDDCDLYYETIDSSFSKYLIDGNWKSLSFRTDTIKIKDSSDVILKIPSTHRGPLINYGHSIIRKQKDLPMFSIKWTGYEISDELMTFYKIKKARNYGDFREAIRHFGSPAQNFLCADLEGNIFYKAGGKIPIKKLENHLLPKDGSISDNDWKGYLNFDTQPEILNPLEGYIATNNNPPSNEFKNMIGFLWEPHSRAERIQQLLSEKQKYTIQDFMNYQMDVVSPFAIDIAQEIVKSFEYVKIKDEHLRQAVEMFAHWNGEMKVYDVTTTIYNEFLIHLLKNTLEDDFGKDLFKEFLIVGNVPLRVLYNVVISETVASISIFDDVRTDKIETKKDIIIKSLIEAIEILKKKYGNNIFEWQWGKHHQVRFYHLFSGQSSIIDHVINSDSYRIGGDQTTLLNTSFRFESPFENYLGPSMRQIVDLSRIDSSLIIITTGQSGHIAHKNYKDQVIKWLNGEYIALETNKEKYTKFKLLKLQPN